MKPRFKRTKISVATTLVSTGLMETCLIEADILCGIAVHKAIGVLVAGSSVFSITHIVSGKKISPLFFETDRTAKLAAIALAALPIDWESGDRAQFEWPYLKDAIISISALCGGFVIESAMDAPAGHA